MIINVPIIAFDISVIIKKNTEDGTILINIGINSLNLGICFS